MRTFLLLLLTCLILGGAFLGYWAWQPESPAARLKNKNPYIPKAPTNESSQKLLPGHDVWFKEFDPTTGELTRKFRAEEYVPQNNGTVLVKKPEVWIYGANKQEIQIVGNDGEVVVKNMPDLTSKSRDNAPPAPPSRGRLKTVTMRMFSATSEPGVPDEVLVTDNIQFDNDTLLITTESFTDANGNIVVPDQVPVQVRGKYDFDGRGLKMRWNERDGRLEMLRIRYGKRLVIHDPSSISISSPGAKDTRRAEGPPVTPLAASHHSFDQNHQAASADPSNITLVSYQQTKPHARAAAPARQPKTQPTTSATPYLATFNENVHITQGEDLLATADRMNVDFLTKQETETSTTQPTTKSAQPTGNPSATPPTTAIAEATATTQQSTTEPAPTQPTTRPAAPPIIVEWTGELLIVPEPVNRRMPLVGGSAIISLMGQPVSIIRNVPDQKIREEIKAAMAVYYTADGSASLVPSEESPMVTIKKFLQGKAEPISTIITRSIDYVAGDHLANLGPDGQVIAPADEAAPEKGNVDARWRDGAKIFLANSGQKGGDMSVQRIDAWGNVDVEHPQLSLLSQKLSLFFDPVARATTRPSKIEQAGQAPQTQPASTQPSREPRQQLQLQRVLASTDVHCLLTDSQGKHQTIDGQQLELLTKRDSNGQVLPRRVNADGGVHAFDGEQDLRTQKLEIALRPATRPAQTRPTAATAGPSTRPSGQRENSDVELDWMHASGNVVASSKDGSTANGDDLEIRIVDGEPHAKITSADGKARVIDAKKNIITGPLITAQTRRQIAHIEGPGSVQAIMTEQDGSKPRPLSVTWQSSADLNGPANTIDADRNITFHTVDQDGAVVNSTGDHLHVDLEERPPATQPARDAGRGAGTKPSQTAVTSATTRPTTRRSRSGGMLDGASADPIAQKQVKAVTLDGNARAVSTLADAQGNLLRQRAIEGPKLIYHAGVSAPQSGVSAGRGQAASTSSGQGATFEVPAAGRMLMQDHRAPEKRGPNDAGTGFDSGHGDTAFKWNGHFLFSEADHRATMTGGVIIAYKGSDSKELPVRIIADHVMAEFDPSKAKPATRPATLPAAAAPTTAPAPRPSSDESSLQLRQVIADGTPTAPALVDRNGSQLTALQIRFDPQTHWITASGTREQPAKFIPADGSAVTYAQTLRWNSLTWNVSVVGANVMGK